MNWLGHALTRPAALDYSGVMATLGAMEAAYRAIAEARTQLAEEYGDRSTPQRDYHFGKLTDKARATLTDLQRQAREQFAALRDVADANRNDARRGFHTSPDGRQYRESLAGYAPLAQHMTADQLAERLADATAAGLVGEARAWSDLARSRYPANRGTDSSGTSNRFPTATLRAALDDADSIARTPAERAADAALATVDAAARRFQVFSLTTDSRLARVLDGQQDIGAGNFDSGNIFVAEGGE